MEFSKYTSRDEESNLCIFGKNFEDPKDSQIIIIFLAILTEIFKDQQKLLG